MTPGTVIDVSGNRMTISRLLGGGSEGDVFEMVSADGSSRLALKWYHEATCSPERRAQIAELIERGAPSARFLWPQGLIEDPSTGRFGYVMNVRPDGFAGLAALLRGDVPRSERAVVRFAFELALAFRELHLGGLCYRDINFGNAFMNPSTGAALVCDNDNVGVDGVSRANVLGSRKFMAPEIVRGEAVPSKLTDRYSMAVMLFYLLIVHHPLDGELTELGLIDAVADLRFYGYEPRFCFDPQDESNRPHQDFHKHVPHLWQLLPAEIKDLFTRSFTAGLVQANRRVVDSEWCDALARMRARLYQCPSCHRPEYLNSDGSHRTFCRVCGRKNGDIQTLRVADHVIAVTNGAVVASHHVNGDFDFDRTYGTVEPHPIEQDVFGLRNDTDRPMLHRDHNGKAHDVPPGRRIALTSGDELTLDPGRSGPVRVLVN